MTIMRKQDQIPSLYQSLQFFADLSQYTLQKRKRLNTVTKELRNHKIAYRWGYTTKITITKENHTYAVTSLEKGIALLKEWGILLDPDGENPTTSTPRQIERELNTETTKNAHS